MSYYLWINLKQKFAYKCNFQRHLQNDLFHWRCYFSHVLKYLHGFSPNFSWIITAIYWPKKNHRFARQFFGIIEKPRVENNNCKNSVKMIKMKSWRTHAFHINVSHEVLSDNSIYWINPIKINVCVVMPCHACHELSIKIWVSFKLIFTWKFFHIDN